MVNKLRDKSEEELKLLYIKFFSNELNEEWREITKEADFKNASDEDIIQAIQKQRYSN
ncbi:MAG: hypothetical protein JWR18_1542 [Segetibacter sp.]|jgi:Na+-translocating ferredoxin:NAD+ oxidoreductase RnfC subunit|nr:hypothetical protein [Segetibacter sp.]